MLSKIPGSENLSDVTTKNIFRQLLEKFDDVEHVFESYICRLEFDAVTNMDQIVSEWRQAQCKPAGLSRKTLLAAASR